MKIKDSTSIKISPKNNNDKYFWTASIGLIIGSGNEIKYIAPDKPGTAEILLKITRNGTVCLEKIFRIFVYKQIIILKVDDLVYDATGIVPDKWHRFINYIESKDIKAALGLIGNSLVIGNNSYLSLLKYLASSENFELWNHGYTHELIGVDEKKYKEFSGTSYQYQKKHLQNTQNLAKEKLGITLRSFGAPGNSIDSNTVKVINKTVDIKIWLFGNPYSEKLVLGRFGEIEYPTSNPDYEKFLNNYDFNKDFYMYQIHPNHWDGKQFAEFDQIIDFLIQENVTFITPYDYYMIFHQNNAENSNE